MKRRHGVGCVCEVCCVGFLRGAQPPKERPLPVTREEYIADLDKAFNAGVRAGRERAKREANRWTARA